MDMAWYMMIAYKILVQEYDRKQSIWEAQTKEGGHIKMDFKRTECEDVDWFYWCQYNVHQKNLIHVLMNPGIYRRKRISGLDE
jgi:hypothetical protein